MKASEDIKKLIKNFEGYRSSAYLCSNGYPTIGYGHKIKKGESFGVMNEQKAMELFEQDIFVVESQLQKVLAPILPQLTQNMYDAIVSLVFNIGISRFTNTINAMGKSTKCYTALLRGDWVEASKQMFSTEFGFNKIRKNNKFVLSDGLVKRRAAEQKIFGQ